MSCSCPLKDGRHGKICAVHGAKKTPFRAVLLDRLEIRVSGPAWPDRLSEADAQCFLGVKHTPT